MAAFSSRTASSYQRFLEEFSGYATRRQAAEATMREDPAVRAARSYLEARRDTLGGGSWSIRDGVVEIAPKAALDPAELRATLDALKPWRKGPFRIGDMLIDAEWRSDWKWERVLGALPDIRGKRVCDVGANNGYYLFHLWKHGPELLLGIDPTGPYVAQFELLDALSGQSGFVLDPLGLDALTETPAAFDVVFLMGILYHQTDPVGALRVCERALRSDGVVVLETIVVAGDDDIAWFPQGRYAGARGFYFLPTQRCLESWVRRSNLKIATRSEPVWTTAAEQRSTRFRPGDSLEEGLCSDDPRKTIEGYPAPQRVVWTLTR